MISTQPFQAEYLLRLLKEMASAKVERCTVLVLEYSAVVIRRHVSDINQSQPARLDGLNGRLGWQSQPGLGTPRFAQNPGLIARPLMPVDDGKTAVELEHRAVSSQPDSVPSNRCQWKLP